MDWVYWLRVLNALLASAVLGLCFYKAGWKQLRMARDARVAGLGFICVAMVWGSHARRDEEFNPWIVFITLGLSLCLYGMARFAPGEFPQRDDFSK